MWKNTDIQSPTTPQILLGSNSAGFNRGSRKPTWLFGLKAELTKDDPISTSRLTFYTTSLAFSVFDPLGHQRHRRSPRTSLGSPTLEHLCVPVLLVLHKIHNQFLLVSLTVAPTQQCFSRIVTFQHRRAFQPIEF
jgi:hypothetical protein